ncbi:hypothetical protein GGX14DRAFT_428860 [Mycena pura]|uniref:Uncharacterized protein n=1 Tax=Mycena pura TaxID=153505 RepID=A0AAD6YL39_9AGAR|nr:hypothetical protein GGX14DRAFT_428860 [Mycena pura]
MSTDPSSTIQWYAIDIDPCTGEESERNLELVEPESAAPIGRSTFRLGKTDASPVTRYVGFRYTNGVVPGPRGIIAGQFIQPIFTYIFPELIDFGNPEPVNEFDLIPYIALGSGPFEFGNFLAAPLATPTIVGQLDPWPGFPVPPSTSCPPPSSTSATTTSASASSTPTGPPDIITILAALTRNGKGMTVTTVTALSSSSSAQLFLSIVGADAVEAQPMTPLGFNEFTLDVSTKGKPTSVIVTSNLGGSATEGV